MRWLLWITAHKPAFGFYCSSVLPTISDSTKTKMSKFKSKKDLTHKIEQDKENNKFHFKFPTERRMELDKELKLDALNPY